ncbi:GNAT family N-acetyltransferase [Sphingomonas rustica]|uniref:GNAT family N-acetyltransferase n=1 Tax=Sphingomonas rustica TaxID=3103142 RepID=UPI003D156ADA
MILPVLETARLRLRGIGPEDAEALHPAMTDDALMTWWSSAPHTDLAQTRDYLTYAPATDGMRSWAITRAEDDRAIGWVTVIHKRAGVSEVGYLLAREHWGAGMMAEAVSRVLDLLFREEGQRRVFADTDPDNLGSRTLLERLGFKLEGVLRAEWETHIGVRDTTLYGLLRDEWLNR